MPLVFSGSVTVTMTEEVAKISGPHLQWFTWDSGRGPVFYQWGTEAPATRLLGCEAASCVWTI